MKILACVDHLIVKADIDLLFLGVSGIDSVNKSVAEYVVFFNPCFKITTEIPKVRVLKDALFEIIAVSVDKLARKEDKT